MPRIIPVRYGGRWEGAWVVRVFIKNPDGALLFQTLDEGPQIIDFYYGENNFPPATNRAGVSIEP